MQVSHSHVSGDQTLAKLPKRTRGSHTFLNVQPTNTTEITQVNQTQNQTKCYNVLWKISPNRSNESQKEHLSYRDCALWLVVWAASDSKFCPGCRAFASAELRRRHSAGSTWGTHNALVNVWADGRDSPPTVSMRRVQSVPHPILPPTAPSSCSSHLVRLFSTSLSPDLSTARTNRALEYNFRQLDKKFWCARKNYQQAPQTIPTWFLHQCRFRRYWCPPHVRRQDPPERAACRPVQLCLCPPDKGKGSDKEVNTEKSRQTEEPDKVWTHISWSWRNGIIVVVHASLDLKLHGNRIPRFAMRDGNWRISVMDLDTVQWMRRVCKWKVTSVEFLQQFFIKAVLAQQFSTKKAKKALFEEKKSTFWRKKSTFCGALYHIYWFKIKSCFSDFSLIMAKM